MKFIIDITVTVFSNGHFMLFLVASWEKHIFPQWNERRLLLVIASVIHLKCYVHWILPPTFKMVLFAHICCNITGFVNCVLFSHTFLIFCLLFALLLLNLYVFINTISTIWFSAMKNIWIPRVIGIGDGFSHKTFFCSKTDLPDAIIQFY